MNTEINMLSPARSLGIAAVVLMTGASIANAAVVNATFSSKNVLQGNFESGAANTFLVNNSNARRVGTGGAGGAQRVNQPVLGFTLPTIPVGEMVTSATFGLTLDSPAVNGAPIGFDMVISLMSQTDISGFSAADFTEDVGALGAGTLVATVAVGDVADGSVESFSLSGAALTQFAGLYDAAGNPSQAVVWFRLSTSATVDITDATNDNDRFQLETVGGASGGDIITTLSMETTPIPEPSSLALLGLAAAGLVVRRRR